MQNWKVCEGIYRIPIPIPFPMKYAYCYLLKTTDGWNIVDTGCNTPEAQSVWMGVFQTLNIKPSKIKNIFLTHFHPDHIGLAGWLQELSSASVFISSTELELVEEYWGNLSQKLQHFMTLEQGVPEELTKSISEHICLMEKYVQPLPELRIYEHERLQLDGHEWLIVETPGHSDGHISFYEPERKLLLGGDFILDKITPNISLWPDSYPNPLQSYLASLRKALTMDIKLTLPAHGQVIKYTHQRIKELIKHHEERLEKIYTLAQQGRNVYQMTELLFTKRRLTPGEWSFALAETLAHLEFLEQQGKLEKMKRDECMYYTKLRQEV